MRHILFSVAGMTPGVITETLYGLLQSGIRGGEIHILTTSEGRDGRMDGYGLKELARPDGKVAEFNQVFATQWEIRDDWIKVLRGANGEELADLRSAADNEAAANAISAGIRAWCEQADVVLHASVAGGRKTMGLFLAQAMSWYARPADTLSHVLVDPRFEVRDFYYPDPNNPAHCDALDFACLPFVRMRGLLPPLLDQAQTYSERVKLAQIYLEDMSASLPLLLDLRRRTLSARDYVLARLSPVSVGLYLFLFEHANLAEAQEPFYFKTAFVLRDELAACLGRAAEGWRGGKGGLSALARSRCETDWPSWWRELGDAEAGHLRETDLSSAFSRLKNELNNALWPNASFRVHLDMRKGHSSRWLDLDKTRLRLCD
jgi:CRISPR-associated protein (TIGR02584 family)